MILKIKVKTNSNEQEIIKTTKIYTIKSKNKIK